MALPAFRGQSTLGHTCLTEVRHGRQQEQEEKETPPVVLANFRRSQAGSCYDYIEVFYNSQRTHSFLGFASPAEYEAMDEQHEGIAA